MALKLTPELLAGTYQLLASTQPFASWKLPEADEVEFHISRQPNYRGQYWRTAKNDHAIEISERLIGNLGWLIRTMAHEMVHLYQSEYKHETPNAQHNAHFYKMAKKVCLVHEWDYRLF